MPPRIVKIGEKERMNWEPKSIVWIAKIRDNWWELCKKDGFYRSNPFYFLPNLTWCFARNHTLFLSSPPLSKSKLGDAPGAQCLLLLYPRYHEFLPVKYHLEVLVSYNFHTIRWLKTFANMSRGPTLFEAEDRKGLFVFLWTDFWVSWCQRIEPEFRIGTRRWPYASAGLQ